MPRPVKRKPRSTQPLTPTALQRASALKTENPSFVIVLQPSYVNSCRLTLPVDFARKYLTKMVNQVILLLSNGKSWPVIYYQHRIEGPKPNVKFGDGWSKFVVDNNLDVGDACVFQLTEAAVSSMNVTIYKKQAVEDANPGSSSGK
ncbi:related to vernalization1 1 [Hibiscus trionum]|uniref:Related to vernalization1 1 n=1 Tax=Hibiscus trionum TaxID=183268 RepID=A0A9W7GZW3_HIBTR|nr:related to vernalization1 1 [Hibiscus trionum]